MAGKKALAILLMMVMIVGLVPCVSFAAGESKIIYYNDFETTDMSANATIAAKSNKIELYTDKDNSSVMISTNGMGAAEDAFFQATTKGINWDNVIVAIDLSMIEGGLSGNMQFKDASNKQSALFSFNKSNVITSVGSGKELTTLSKGKWTKIAFAINFATKKYTTYVNGKIVEKNVDLSGSSAKEFNFMRLYMSKGSNGDMLIDNFAIYEGTEPRDITEEVKAMPSPTPVITPKPAGSGKDYLMNYADLSKLDEGITLLVDNPNAYAKKALTKVDTQNESVVPVVINGRTLVPIRFISENYGAAVGWDEATSKVTINGDGKVIELTIGEKAMSVNGSITELDVPAETINDRTMLPLRALVEALGKNVFWDNRGLIVITNSNITLDAVIDERLVGAMLAYLKSGKLALNYSTAPDFTQSILDDAIHAKLIEFTPDKGNNTNGAKGAKALYYLTLATRLNPNTASSDGVLAKDAALKQLRQLIGGGNEPYACVGPYWSHAVVATDLVLVKNTPEIYNELTSEEKDRMDWLMKALAIAGNWGFNDLNNYKTGVDLLGNFNKTWNPNYRNTYLNVVLSGAMYFGAQELDKIYTSFSYDEYMKAFEKYGFTNIIATWSVAGKDIMEKGGEVILLGGIGAGGQVAGESGGKGAGVKIPFKYKGMGLDNINGIFSDLVTYTYGAVGADSFTTPDGKYNCYIISGKSSPWTGYNGMMLEFASGSRSSAGYCYDSMMIVMPMYANLKLFYAWDSTQEWQQKLDSLIYVGTEDLIFKLQEGYMDYSTSFGGGQRVAYEYNSIGSGYPIDKDLWRNFHNMKSEKIVVKDDPNKKPDITTEKIEPKDGITAPPSGAMVASYETSSFSDKSTISLGEKYTGDVTTEFDVVFDNDVTPQFDGVIMYDQAGAKGMSFAKANVLIQFNAQTINIRNGDKYQWSTFPVAANYRYHFKVKMNAATKKYSVWVTPTYPVQGSETLIAENYSFRVGAQDISDIGSIIPVKATSTGGYWIENHKIIK